jgi:hypothetical protein
VELERLIRTDDEGLFGFAANVIISSFHHFRSLKFEMMPAERLDSSDQSEKI